ncbi:hypothetical protein C8R47DRAFT_1130092 [Mycena vitilis]|nr:hypothetical protein C8R47DRAFT_1130092 [Mycena vitilis]
MPRTTTFIIETTGGAPVFHIPVPISLLDEHENVRFVFRNFGGTPTFHVGGADVGVAPGEAYDYITTTVAVMRERRIKLEKEGQDMLQDGMGAAGSSSQGTPQVRIKLEEQTPRVPKRSKGKEKAREDDAEGDSDQAGSKSAVGGAPNATDAVPSSPEELLLIERGSVELENFAEVYEHARQDFALRCAPSEPPDRTLTSVEEKEWRLLWEAVLALDRENCGPTRDPEELRHRSEEMIVAAVRRAHRQTQGIPVPLPDAAAESNPAQARFASAAIPPTDDPVRAPAAKERVRRPGTNDVTNGNPPPKNRAAPDVQAATSPMDEPVRAVTCAEAVKVGGKSVKSSVQGGEANRGPKERVHPPNMGTNLPTQTNEEPGPRRVSSGKSVRDPAKQLAPPAAKAPPGDVATTNSRDGNAAALQDPGAARRFIDLVHTRLEKPAPPVVSGFWAAAELERRKANGAVGAPASRGGDAAPRAAAVPARNGVKTKPDAEAAGTADPTDVVVQPPRPALPPKAIPPRPTAMPERFGTMFAVESARASALRDAVVQSSRLTLPPKADLRPAATRTTEKPDAEAAGEAAQTNAVVGSSRQAKASSRPAAMPARTSVISEAEAGGAAAQTDAVVESARRALAPLHAEMRDQAHDKARDKIVDSPHAASSSDSPSTAAIVARNLIASRRPTVKRNENGKEASWPPVRGHGRGKEREREVKENAKSVSGEPLQGESDAAALPGSKRAADADGGPVNIKRPRRGGASEPEKKPPMTKKSTSPSDRPPTPTVPAGFKALVATAYVPGQRSHWAWGLSDSDNTLPAAETDVAPLTPAECAWLGRQDDLARAPDWWRPVKWHELGERMCEAHAANLPVRPLHHGLLLAAWDRGEWRFEGVGHEHVGRVGTEWRMWILSKEGQAWRAGK